MRSLERKNTKIEQLSWEIRY